jgi:hypothetical protein
MAKKPAKETQPAPEAQAKGIKVEQAAALLRVSVRRVQQLMQEGLIRRDANGVLSIVAVVHGYLDAKDKEIEQIRLKAADNDVRRAKASLLNMSLAEKQRELVPRDEAEEFVQLLIGEVVSRLQGLPARFTRDVNERKRLDGLVGAIRAEVADIARKLGEAFRTGADLVDTAGEDDAGSMGEEAQAV